MAAKRIYSCILFLAIVVLMGNQQCQAVRNLLQSPSPAPQPQEQGMHFVLVHGAGHGAWCWYKLQTLMEAAGHRVTAIDLAASGIDPRSLDDLRTYVNYTQPLLDLMESISEYDKVILVGHSQGGLNLAFAMEQYPRKMFCAIFVSAFVPDTVHSPYYVPAQYFERYGTGMFLDTQFAPFGRPEDNLTSILFGPKLISSSLYNLSPPEDATLAKSLVRPNSLFTPYLENRSPFSNETYGSVKRAYVSPIDDKLNPVEFQRWNIKNSGVTVVREINGSDHMVMISKPEELCQCLLDIANTFSQK